MKAPVGDAAPGKGRFMGIDLTASQRRASSICILSPKGEAFFHEARLDDEIVELARHYSPACTAIDAPLSYPFRGRGFRICDREAMRMGVRIFPVLFGPMRLLAGRGIELASRLRELGFEVIETFPSGAQRILGLWRGGERRASTISRGLKRLGLKIPKYPNLDMVDAATCAYVALLHYHKLSKALGDPSEGLLILPAKSTRLSALRRSSCRSMRGSRLSRPS